MITGPSENYIFLPAVGQRYGTNIGSQKTLAIIGQGLYTPRDIQTTFLSATPNIS